MSTIIKAAAVQISPVLYSRTVAKVVKKIRDLGKQGVQFATFPETVVPYYRYFSFIQAPLADPIEAGHVASFGRPVGNMTGITSMSMFGGKPREILFEMAPAATR